MVVDGEAAVGGDASSEACVVGGSSVLGSVSVVGGATVALGPVVVVMVGAATVSAAHVVDVCVVGVTGANVVEVVDVVVDVTETAASETVCWSEPSPIVAPLTATSATSPSAVDRYQVFAPSIPDSSDRLRPDLSFPTRFEPMSSDNRSDDLFNASTWLVDRHVAEGRGEQVAIRCLGASVTYRELQALVERTAGALRSVGVQPEQRVAMVMLDSIEFVTTFLGAMRIGAIPLPMNPLLPGRDLGTITADSRARIVVVSGDRAASIADLMAVTPEVDLVVVTDTEQGTSPAVAAGNEANVISWDGFLVNEGHGVPHETWGESPGFWLCTSGSTGRPKLAMHRHIDIKVTCDTYADQVLNASSEDRFYSVGPMFHAYGLGNSISFP